VADAAADDVDLSFGGDDGEVVARDGERRCLRPIAGRRIVDLVRRDRLVVARASANDVDFSVDHGPRRERRVALSLI